MALISALQTHPLEICAGNRQWRLFPLTPRMQLPLVPRVFNKFNSLAKRLLSKYMIPLPQLKTRTASSCMLGCEIVFKI
jgi:hypothetical protein